jgi:hypothetical protein
MEKQLKRETELIGPLVPAVELVPVPPKVVILPEEEETFLMCCGGQIDISHAINPGGKILQRRKEKTVKNLSRRP